MIIGGMAGKLGYDDQDLEGLDPDIQQMFYGEGAMAADETAGQEQDSVERPVTRS
jgi:hypothetical protein